MNELFYIFKHQFVSLYYTYIIIIVKNKIGKMDSLKNNENYVLDTIYLKKSC